MTSIEELCKEFDEIRESIVKKPDESLIQYYMEKSGKSRETIIDEMAKAYLEFAIQWY